jgi:hypothetical protein
MAYKELRPMQPANDGNHVQPPFAEEACVQALAGLATVNTTVQKAIKQNSLPPALGTSLRYVIFLFRCYSCDQFSKCDRFIFIIYIFR